MLVGGNSATRLVRPLSGMFTMSRAFGPIAASTALKLKKNGVSKHRWTIPADTLSLVRELARLMPDRQFARLLPSRRDRPPP